MKVSLFMALLMIVISISTFAQEAISTENQNQTEKQLGQQEFTQKMKELNAEYQAGKMTKEEYRTKKKELTREHAKERNRIRKEIREEKREARKEKRKEAREEKKENKKQKNE